MELLLALALFFALMTVVQHFERKARATLSSEERTRLMDSNDDSYKRFRVPITILLLAFGGFGYFLRPGVGALTTGLIVFIALIAAQTIAFDQRHARKLLTLGLPAEYLATAKKTRLTTMVASMVLFLWLGVSAISNFDEYRRKLDQLKLDMEKVQGR